jgi:sRNA-binding carbon storage regulator CsrA
MPLVIDRRRNQDVVIGDHSVISVVGFDSGEVRLAFHTKDHVQRADWPESMMAAAKIKARSQMIHSQTQQAMQHRPVYVGFKTYEDGRVDIRASLQERVVDVAGYKLAELSDTTNLAPDNHQFLVVRCLDKAEVDVLEKLIVARLLNWRLYEKQEADDATTYVLFLQAVKTREGGDVRYVDLLEL